MLFDIHSHILPAVDDGAENLEESIELLKIMQSQGITDVMATPHFYPVEDNLEDYKCVVDETFENLKKITTNLNLPQIYLGCELLYFYGISNTEDLSPFCLNKSSYLLLELTEDCIDETLFEDLFHLKENGIKPIIAHIERYCFAKKYKKFIKFLIAQNIPVQINAASVLIPQLTKVIKKLLKSDLTCVLSTDTHSLEQRPPYLEQALENIAATYGESYRAKLLLNSKNLYEKIISGGALL